MSSKADIDDQYVDFADGKRTIEEHVKKLSKEYEGRAKLKEPEFKMKDGVITVTHQVESESITKGQVLDIADLFFEWYPGGSAFAKKKLWKSMSRFNMEHEAYNRENELEKWTRVGPCYNKGAQMISGGKVSRLGPHISVEFETSPEFDKRDIVVNKMFYDILLPKEASSEDGKVDLSNMQELGCIVHEDISAYDFGFLAGYEKTKREVHNKIILPNLNKEIFNNMYAHTRKRPEQRGYNCYIFSGVPGVGKTEMAKVAAHELGYNFIELPLESVMTKWYGEAEKQLGRVFDYARKLGPTVLLLDEIDCFAGDRNDGMHEATKRVMSVMMTQTARTKMGDDLVVVATTNKYETMDQGLLRRFKKRIDFPLPEQDDLAAIYAHYAKHLDPSVLEMLAKMSKGFSPFDVMTACATAEEQFVDDLMKSKRGMNTYSLPPEHYYVAGAKKVKKLNDPSKPKIGFGG